jgi:chromosome segregation ATPase
VYKVTAVTADKPENKALKTRVLELMEKLATASKPFAIRKEARQLKAALDEARVALQNVTNRYVEICDKVQNLEEDSKIKQNEIQNLMEEKKRLTEELAKIKAFPKLLKKGGE